MDINEIKHLAIRIEAEIHSSNKARAKYAKKCIQEFDKNEREYLIELFKGKVPNDSKIDPYMFQTKLNAINVKKYHFTRKTSITKSINRWWKNLFGRISSQEVITTIHSGKPPRIQATGNKAIYSDFLSDATSSGHYIVHHFNTNQAKYPQEHIVIKPIKNGFHLALGEAFQRDLAARDEPYDNTLNGLDYSQCAARLVNETLNQSLTQKNPDYFQELAHETDIGLLEIEVTKSLSGSFHIKWADNGSSSFFVISQNGKLLYPNKKNSTLPKGALHEMSFDEPIFLIMGSDGLTNHFKLKNGSIDKKNFQKALTFDRTQPSLFRGKDKEGDELFEVDLTVPPLSKLNTLNCFTIGQALRAAVEDACVVTGKNKDDVTFAVINLHNINKV